MTFTQKMYNFTCNPKPVTRRRLTCCRKAIEEQAELFGGGFTGLQMITLRSFLRTIQKRVEKECPEQREYFNYLFSDIMGYDPCKKEEVADA